MKEGNEVLEFAEAIGAVDICSVFKDYRMAGLVQTA